MRTSNAYYALPPPSISAQPFLHRDIHENAIGSAAEGNSGDAPLVSHTRVLRGRHVNITAGIMLDRNSELILIVYSEDGTPVYSRTFQELSFQTLVIALLGLANGMFIHFREKSGGFTYCLLAFLSCSGEESCSIEKRCCCCILSLGNGTVILSIRRLHISVLVFMSSCRR